MRRLFLCIATLALLLPSLAQAYDVLVLQSRRDAGYEEVMEGFRARQSTSQRVIVLSDYAETDVVRIVREDRPKLVLALGDAAVSAAHKIQHTPVIALMSLAIHNQNGISKNMTGIGMCAEPERYLDLLASMKIRRVGVLHSRSRTGWYVNKAGEAARKAGIELVIRELNSPRELSEQLASLRGKVDALWMLPDITAVTRDNIEAWFRFGQEQNIPVISFAAPYLNLGAAAVLELDRLELGGQAAETAVSILRGTKVTNASYTYPGSATLRTNTSVMRRLGIKLN